MRIAIKNDLTEFITAEMVTQSAFGRQLLVAMES
jgi:hypothetical protein